MALHDRLHDKRLLIAGSTLFAVAVAVAGLLTFVLVSPSCACTTPPPKFVFEEVETGNGTSVIISNNRGDFRARTLSVAVEGNTTAWTAHGNATGHLGNDTAVVTDDRYTVGDVEPGDEIRVLWTPRNQNESQEMARYVVGRGTPTED